MLNSTPNNSVQELSQSRVAEQSVFRSLWTWMTVIIYVLLVAAGAVSIYAASYDFDHASIFFIR